MIASNINFKLKLAKKGNQLMNKHHILGIRSYIKDGKEKKSEKFFDKNWRADNLQDVLMNPTTYLEQIPEEERYNIFVTFAKCLEQPGRRLGEQWVIPFDIDEVDYTKLDLYTQVICDTLNIKLSETGIVATGNGLHVLVGIDKPILDAEAFENNRIYYKELCSQIEEALKAKGLTFKEVDPMVFSEAFMTRLPGTKNIKKDKPDSMVSVVNPFIVPIDFDLKERSGLSEIDSREALTKSALKEKFKGSSSDNEYILSNCAFMAYAATATDLSERQWYNALSIAVHMRDGFKVAHDISRQDPRYTEAETARKAEQAYHRSGPVKCSTIAKTYTGCQQCPHWGKCTSPILLKGEEFIASAEFGFRTVTDKGPGKIVFTDLVKQYKKDHVVKVENEGAVFNFNGKYWVPVSDNKVEAYAYHKVKPTPLSHECKEFLAQLSYTDTISMDWFTDSTKGFMNFNNGILNLGSFELLPHSPEFGFLNCVPFDFDKNADCPLWKKTINKVTLNREDLANVLQEFSGYILSGSECRWHKALLLSGEGHNGKSTFMETLMYCIGKSNYSSLPFHTVVTEKENTNMAHKLVNFTEEVGDKEFLNSSAPIKNLIAGGEFRIRDLYKKGYEIKNRTKFVLACNKLPKTNDTSKGFMRRWLIVPFEATINAETDKEFDVHIQDKLQLEAPGIINWMVEGWKRLSEKGFTGSEIVKMAIEDYIDANDSVVTFSKDHLNLKIDAKAHRAQVYSSYSSYCLHNGLKPKGSPEFYRQLKIIFPKIVYARSRVQGNPNPVHCILNLEMDGRLTPDF